MRFTQTKQPWLVAVVIPSAGTAQPVETPPERSSTSTSSSSSAVPTVDPRPVTPTATIDVGHGLARTRSNSGVTTSILSPCGHRPVAAGAEWRQC